MRSPVKAALFVAALLTVGQVTWADEGPRLTPTKEVAVTYQLSGTSQQQGAQKLQVSWGDRGRARLDFYRYLDAKLPFGALIYDPTTDRITTILPERQGFVQRDVGKLPSPAAFLNSDMKFTRKGTATVAGLPCTDWRVLKAGTEEGTACVTEDGVVLRATRERPGPGLIEAIAVRVAPMPADAFVPPPKFEFIPSPDFPDIKAPPGVATRGSPQPPAAAPATTTTPKPPSAAAPTDNALPPGWSVVGTPEKK